MLQQTLQKVFGYDDFRPGQRPVIEALASSGAYDYVCHGHWHVREERSVAGSQGAFEGTPSASDTGEDEADGTTPDGERGGAADDESAASDAGPEKAETEEKAADDEQAGLSDFM